MKNILAENMRRFRTKNLNEEVDKNALRNVSQDLVNRMNNAIDTYIKNNPKYAPGIKKHGRASIDPEPAGDNIYYYINIPGARASRGERPYFEWRRWVDPNQTNIRPGQYISNVNRMQNIPLVHLRDDNKIISYDMFPVLNDLKQAVYDWAEQLRQADTSTSGN